MLRKLALLLPRVLLLLLLYLLTMLQVVVVLERLHFQVLQLLLQGV